MEAGWWNGSLVQTAQRAERAEILRGRAPAFSINHTHTLPSTHTNPGGGTTHFPMHRHSHTVNRHTHNHHLLLWANTIARRCTHTHRLTRTQTHTQTHTQTNTNTSQEQTQTDSLFRSRLRSAKGKQAVHIKFPDTFLNIISMHTSYMICFNLSLVTWALSVHTCLSLSFVSQGLSFSPFWLMCKQYSTDYPNKLSIECSEAAGLWFDSIFSVPDPV